MRTHDLAAPMLAAVVSMVALGQPARAQVEPFPASFHARRIPTNGTSLYVRSGSLSDRLRKSTLT